MGYYGWTNRETQLVDFHFGSGFFEHMTEGLDNGFNEETDDIQTVADEYKAFVNMHIGEEVESLGAFLSDLLDLDEINWAELADNMIEELKRGY